MKLSIIVPCYNVRDYVAKCIHSLETQDIKQEEFEVLVYNDGSTDDTLNVIQEIVKEYSNVRVESHTNIGLSGTRNRRIREARGEYVWCIDSDDWIEPNCLSSILSEINEPIDILAFSCYYSEGVDGTRIISNCQQSVENKTSLFTHGFADGAPFYIYRKDFLLEKNLFFKEGIKHEDVNFTPVVLSEAKTFGFYKMPVYHYLKRGGSISTTADFVRLRDLSDTLAYHYSYLKNIEDEEIRKGFMNHMARKIIEMLIYGVDNGRKGAEYSQHIMRTHPEYWDILRNAIDSKPKFLYWIMRITPLKFTTTFRLLCRFRTPK